jgi:hypothetical protein
MLPKYSRNAGASQAGAAICSNLGQGSLLPGGDDDCEDVGCGAFGHDLQRVDDPEHGERITCRRGDLDVPRPADARSLGTAYRTWAGPQGYLEGVERTGA